MHSKARHFEIVTMLSAAIDVTHWDLAYRERLLAHSGYVLRGPFFRPFCSSMNAPSF